MKKGLIIFPILLLFLSACGGADPEPTPLVRTLPPEVVQQQTARTIAATLPPATAAPPTETPPPTATIVGRIATATPPINRDAFVSQSFNKGPWRTSHFTDLDGARRTLSEFEGSTVIVQTLSTTCGACRDQSAALIDGVAALADAGNAPNLVVIQLGIDALDNLNTLRDYQAEFRPATLSQVRWVTGIASESLLRDLRTTFGETYINRSTGGIIFLDAAGFGHLSDEGILDGYRLRDVGLNILGQLEYLYGTPEATEEPAN